MKGNLQNICQNAVIIGTGPAALIAADILSQNGISVRVFEKRKGAGWKLLVAGSSGLNVTYSASPEEFSSFYKKRQVELTRCFSAFGPEAWLEYLRGLGEEPYLGSSRRYFVKEKTASKLLQAWLDRLKEHRVDIVYEEEFVDFQRKEGGEIEVMLSSGRKESTRALLLALGGASWEKLLPPWLDLMERKGIACEKFASANTGYHLSAPNEFFAAAEGQAIKGAILTTSVGRKQGEFMITWYGLEGTPVYTVGCSGPATLDLKPEMTEAQLLARLSSARGTPWQRVERAARLSEGALSLLQFLAPVDAWASPANAAKTIKQLAIQLLEARPLSEAISSRGGVSWDELDEKLELKKIPGVFCAGEMIDWDAPTGGFLLQACVSTAYVAAHGILGVLKK